MLGAATLLLLSACHDRDHQGQTNEPGFGAGPAIRPAATIASSPHFRLQQETPSFAGPRGTTARSDHYLIVLGGSADEQH